MECGIRDYIKEYSREKFNQVLDTILSQFPEWGFERRSSIQPNESLDKLINVRIINKKKSKGLVYFFIDIVYCPPDSEYNESMIPHILIKAQSPENAVKVDKLLKEAGLKSYYISKEWSHRVKAALA